MAAALLTKLIDKSVTVNVLIKWLTNEDDDAPISDELSASMVNKSDFVPYFLDYLRGETSWLLRDTKPSSISPLKTPISARNVKANGHYSCTPGPRSNTKTPSSTQRVQHFESRTQENSFSSNVSYETPPQKWGTRSNNSSGSFSETSFAGSTSGRKENRRQRPQRSLGDFFSPANSGRPDGVHRDDCSPSLSGRRSSAQGNRPSERSTWTKNSARNEDLKLPVFSLTNADDFPAVTQSKEAPSSRQSVVTAKSRRIVPTPVSFVGQSDDPSTSFLKVVDVPAPAKVMPRSIWAKPPENISGNPELDMLMKRSRALPRGNVKSDEVESAESLIVDVVPESTSDPQTMSNDRHGGLTKGKPVTSTDAVQGSLELVTYCEEIEVLACFYAQCIQEGLVSNVMMELYFLVQLLTVRSSQNLGTALDSEGFDSGMCYLSTVHNAVFFATSSLLYLHSFLSLLDRSTLRPMSENPRVSLFSPKLKDLLLGLCDQPPPLLQIHAVSYSSPLGGVIFQPETDNRSNFPTDRSFHTFKKQRDAFYELLRQWEEKHLCVGWSMRESQAAAIQWLMDGCLPDLANYVHLVRLFVLQLIKMCSAEGSSSQKEEKDAKLRQELKEANPDKLKRLQERLTNPVSVGGICPPPSFPGCQEFFRDFISIAASHVFNQHLADTLRSKINKLMKKSEMNGYAELTDTTSAQEKHEELLQSLLMLRILGKFLGSLSFLPYRSTELPPESVKLSSIKIRNEVQQPVDILLCLTSAVGRERTLLCIVWVVDFLSQMDFIAPLLNYYQDVFGHLVDIYWSCIRLLSGQRSYAFFLMATLLGWLFELFPEVLFYQRKQRIAFSDQWNETKSHSLDIFSLIDLRVLYACCPMLGELRALLVDFSAECNSSSGCIRKITPVKTSAPVSQPRPKSKKDVQQRLLDGFFDMHPDSLRQTVNFAADRVASNFVKFFQAHCLSKHLERIQAMAKEEARGLSSSSLTTAEENETEAIRRLKRFAEDALKDVQNDGKAESRRYCTEKVDSVMAGLLSEETAPAVRSLVGRIAMNRALCKVDAWLTEKLTLDFFFKDLRSVFNHELRLLSSEPTDCNLVPLKRTEEHRDSAPAPSDVLSDVKHILLDLLVKGGALLNSNRMSVAVTSIEEVAIYRQDLLASVLTHIVTLSISLACYTILYRPDLWNGQLEQHLIKIWEMLNCRSLFERITCAKHVHCFKKSSEESQKKFVDLLRVLTNKSLVKAETLDVFTRTVDPL